MTHIFPESKELPLHKIILTIWSWSTKRIERNKRHKPRWVYFYNRKLFSCCVFIIYLVKLLIYIFWCCRLKSETIPTYCIHIMQLPKTKYFWTKQTSHTLIKTQVSFLYLGPYLLTESKEHVYRNLPLQYSSPHSSQDTILVSVTPALFLVFLIIGFLANSLLSRAFVLNSDLPSSINLEPITNYVKTSKALL